MNLELNKDELFILSVAMQSYTHITFVDYRELLRKLGREDYNLMYKDHANSEMQRMNAVWDKILSAHREICELEKYVELKEKFERGDK